MWETIIGQIIQIMQIEIVGHPLYWILRCEALHFLLGFVVGLSLCWLILTICGVGDARIRRYSFYLCASLAIASHVLQDYTVGWF